MALTFRALCVIIVRMCQQFCSPHPIFYHLKQKLFGWKRRDKSFNYFIKMPFLTIRLKFVEKWPENLRHFTRYRIVFRISIPAPRALRVNIDAFMRSMSGAQLYVCVYMTPCLKCQWNFLYYRGHYSYPCTIVALHTHYTSPPNF